MNYNVKGYGTYRKKWDESKQEAIAFYKRKLDKLIAEKQLVLLIPGSTEIPEEKFFETVKRIAV